MFFGILTVFLALLADQASKFVVDTKLVIDEPIELCDYFNLVKVRNTGISFSMFNDYGDAGKIVLTLFALVVVIFLLHWMYKEDNRLKILGLGLIIGGALGNVVDRVRAGAVLDFLDFHYKTMHWPAFNLADTFICIGAFLLIWLEIYAKQNNNKYMRYRR
ncbi:MAG: signal peptidase II [Alphaproteobacteria bacterium]|nr:signal peptidase II [Alphaproteobacteria bacterium]